MEVAAPAGRSGRGRARAARRPGPRRGPALYRRRPGLRDQGLLEGGPLRRVFRAEGPRPRRAVVPLRRCGRRRQDRRRRQAQFPDPGLRPARGELRGGFKVPFAPDKVFALAAERLLVTANPTGRRKGERLLHLFEASGPSPGRGSKRGHRPTPSFDTFRNMILVCPGEEGDFHVVFRSGERTICPVLRRRGPSRGRSPSTSVMRSRSWTSPSRGGSNGCSASAGPRPGTGACSILSAPEAVDGTGPRSGKEVVRHRRAGPPAGRRRARRAPSIASSSTEGRMFAIDDDGDLRIFEVGR